MNKSAKTGRLGRTSANEPARRIERIIDACSRAASGIDVARVTKKLAARAGRDAAK